ncbi:MAG: helix-turn-helix transcriptional regulator [Parvularculaceae bacterium]
MIEHLTIANDAVRGFGLSILFAWAVFVIRDLRTNRASLFACLLAASAASFLFVNRWVESALPDLVTLVLVELSRSGYVILWLLTLHAYRPAFTVTRFHVAVVIAWEVAFWLFWLPPRVAPGYESVGLFDAYLSFTRLAPVAITATIETAFAIALLAASARAVTSQNKPLRPAREQKAVDLFFLSAIALLAIDLAASAPLLLTGRPFAEPVKYFQVAENFAVATLAFAALAWLLGVRRLRQPDVKTAPAKPTGARLTAQRLTDALDGGAYLNGDLTISALAKSLGVATATLRTVIKQELGYANFRQMLNHYRVEAAKASLSAPATANASIQMIALDCGFMSTASFHRIFKSATDETPNAFRSRVSRYARVETHNQ